MDCLTYFLYFIIGILPAILWLLFYLRQDVHPESNQKVIEIFLWGVICVLPAMILENGLNNVFPSALLYYLFGVGFVEEFLKYIVVKSRVINTSHFDEPIDAMLYLIIAGLGFAAAENILFIFSEGMELGKTLLWSSFRMVSAIFLHTLAAGIIGYFLALSLYHKKKIRGLIVSFGLILGFLFHGFYDFSLVKLAVTDQAFSFLFPVGIILLMTILVYLFFSKVKKLPRACQL